MEPTWSEALQQINALLTPAKEVAVILRANPSPDTLCAALSLNTALKKLGRRSYLICPDKLEISGILTDFPKKQLTLNLYYQEGSFQKAQTQKTGEGLNLLLAVQAGGQAIEPQELVTTEAELQPEVCFLVEVENLVHLGQLYQKNQAFFSQVPLVNLDYHQANSRYGKINLLDPKAVGVSEIVTLMLYDLRVPLDPEIAQELYRGLAAKSQNFAQNYFSANFLEAASICLRYQKPVKAPSPAAPANPAAAPAHPATPPPPPTWPQG
jgi:nanoRNase/pAp phosphatase (c-di-AMP/oligoRNAs hydrolase)